MSKMAPTDWRPLNSSCREVLLDFGKQEQKEEWYRKMTPNGRIPAIVDHWNNDKVVWESNAVLRYIVNCYDSEGKFLVTDPDQQTEVDTCTSFCVEFEPASKMITFLFQSSSSKPPTKAPTSASS